ncbi:MAG TPA: FAD-dependent monooxygenase [Xanthobacteraceae bacterium]
MNRRTNRRAVIIGGGIAGLLAGHVLAARFERVTILERGSYPADASSLAPPARRGVPQSRCLHLLTAAGAATFDKLAPGWREDLIALGARPFDVSADSVLRVPTGSLPRVRSGMITYACSRALLENVLRRGLAANSRVRLREGHKVVGLLCSLRDRRVSGVRTAARISQDAKTFLADLVVDASGAGSTLSDWISRLPHGLASVVEQTVIEGGSSYVSRWFHIEPADAPDWSCFSIAPRPDAGLRSAMMLRAERNRWGLVLLAPASESPPCDDVAFLGFIARFDDPELQSALRHARPVSPIHRYGPTPNRMMRYERLTAWPRGLVATGDSVCTLDPYFGLGMTAAARGAALLGKYLDRQPGTPVRGLDFQNELASLNAQPWQLATGCDPDGWPLERDRLKLQGLYDNAPSSPEAAHALLAVQHLLRPAETLEAAV